MKWFKHQTNARNDERMAKLADLSGLEGYGFYFMVLEIIAENMDETNRNYAEYSVDYWAKKLGLLPNKFKKLLENCIESGLFLVEKDIKNGHFVLLHWNVVAWLHCQVVMLSHCHGFAL